MDETPMITTFNVAGEFSMDLDEEGGAKIRNQTQSDGKIFAEEDSDFIGEVPVRTKVIKL